MSGFVLPLPAAPFRDESLPGLIMRNAEPYRYRDPMRLFRRLQLKQKLLWPLCQTDPGGEVGGRLGHLIGLDAATYRHLSPWSPDDARTSIMGHGVWSELVPSDRRAVCPECLRESPHHRAVWLVAALPVCAVHGVRLVDRCRNPACSKPLRWNGRSHCECEWRGCRADLRQARGEPIDLAPFPGIVRLAELFRPDAPPSSPLGIPVGEAVTVAFMLGRVALGFERQARPSGLMVREWARMPEMMDAGWRALDDWPNGFNALLDARKARGVGRRGVMQAFGGLSLLVHNWSREPWGAPIGKAFAEYATRQTDLALSPRQVTRYAPGGKFRKPHVSLTDAGKILGISPGAVLRLANRRGLFVIEPQGMGVASVLKASDVRMLAREFKDWLLPEEGRKLIGVGWKLFTELEDAGLIRRLPEEERIMEARPFLRRELEAFLAACVGTAPTMTEDEADARGLTVPMEARSPGHGIAEVCRALVEGRLRCRAVIAGLPGLRGLRIKMSELRTVVDNGRETLSVVDAARTIHVKWTNLHVWVRRGLLEASHSDRRGENGLRIRHGAWERFRAEYVAGTDLSHLFGEEENKGLSRHIRYQGVEPVSGPSVDEAETFLFRRSDCGPGLVAAIRRVQARPAGSPQDKHRAAFEKAGRVAAVIAGRWGTTFRRTNNFFEDKVNGRVLQVVSGRRPDLMGVFRFMLQATSVQRLSRMGDAWVALVPAQGDTFLLLPSGKLDWRGKQVTAQYVTIKSDVEGRPLERLESAVTLPQGNGE